MSLTVKEQSVLGELLEEIKTSPKVEVPLKGKKYATKVKLLKKASVREHLADNSIVTNFDIFNKRVYLYNNDYASRIEKNPVLEKEEKKGGSSTHTYVLPKFHNRMKALIQDESSLITCGTGGTGTGKTCHMRIMAKELGMKLFLINCKKDMDTASFIGEKTVSVDEKTAQNFVEFVEGSVIKAMVEGLDEDGNEVGAPGLLVIDEFPMIPSWIAIGFNNLLEGFSNKRKLVLDSDGGRVVESHSGFRIVLLGNTIGKGLNGINDANYTAQTDALDASTLDRISLHLPLRLQSKG
jgi:hypothetical protein